MATHERAIDITALEYGIRLAEARLAETETILSRTKEETNAVAKRMATVEKVIRRLNVILDLRSFLDRTMTRKGGFLNVVLLGFMLGMLVFSLFISSWLWRFFGAFLGSIAATALGIKILSPSDHDLWSEIANQESERRGLANKAATLQRLAEESTRDLVSATTQLANSRRHYESKLNAHHSKINQLLHHPWHSLTGRDFEFFLADVFRELGYDVKTTKITGDQGVDLILRLNGREIAVQVKGYIESTVSNKAVQEAYTGMTFYKCHTCAVITNSYFTSGANALAQGVGCVLIDRNGLPDLIRGRTRL